MFIFVKSNGNYKTMLSKKDLFNLTAPDVNDLPEFEIEVWYRFTVRGQVEKDFDIHKVKAYDLKEAFEKVKSMYTSKNRIPFGFYYNNEKLTF
jgi:hypothetical protein